MQTQDIIKAIAELDGWTDLIITQGVYGFNPTKRYRDRVPPYLTSRDAIVPVIEKQRMNAFIEVGIQLAIMRRKHCEAPLQHNVEGWIMVALTATPSQLCEALLRATGKWIE